MIKVSVHIDKYGLQLCLSNGFSNTRCISLANINELKEYNEQITKWLTETPLPLKENK